MNRHTLVVTSLAFGISSLLVTGSPVFAQSNPTSNQNQRAPKVLKGVQVVQTLNPSQYLSMLGSTTLSLLTNDASKDQGIFLSVKSKNGTSFLKQQGVLHGKDGRVVFNVTGDTKQVLQSGQETNASLTMSDFNIEAQGNSASAFLQQVFSNKKSLKIDVVSKSMNSLVRKEVMTFLNNPHQFSPQLSANMIAVNQIDANTTKSANHTEFNGNGSAKTNVGTMVINVQGVITLSASQQPQYWVSANVTLNKKSVAYFKLGLPVSTTTSTNSSNGHSVSWSNGSTTTSMSQGTTTSNSTSHSTTTGISHSSGSSFTTGTSTSTGTSQSH